MAMKDIHFSVLPHFPIENVNGRLKRLNGDDDKRYTCVFCRSAEVDEVNLGPLYMDDGVVTHYFCLLFSSGLSQKGSDKEGVLGFLQEDILAEVRRGTRLKCIYCHMIGASVGCCDRRCKATFHYPCGLGKGANYQFFGNFESFCINHSKRTTLDTLPSDLECPICFSKHDSTDNLIVGSCCKSAVFHKACIQQHAFSAGYFFKCPICNAQASFILDMKKQGIFVPEQDASWEREPNAYQELLQQYSNCDANECQCPRGRNYGASKGQWLLARCRICGAAGTHRQCGKLTTIANWACDPCLEIEHRTKQNKPKPKKRSMKSTSTSSSQKPDLNSIIASVANNSTTTYVSNYKAKRTKTTSLIGSVKDEVNLNTISIMPSCGDYFPHDAASIQSYALRSKGLPDWRNLEIRVELVDLFKEDAESPKKSAVNGKLVSTAAQDNKNKKAAGKVSVGEKPQVGKTASEKRNNTRKRSSWKKGVVKARKRSSKSISISSDDLKETVTAAIAKRSSAASTAVLEGIRRSQSSAFMRNWLNTASVKTEALAQVKSEIIEKDVNG